MCRGQNLNLQPLHKLQPCSVLCPPTRSAQGVDHAMSAAKEGGAFFHKAINAASGDLDTLNKAFDAAGDAYKQAGAEAAGYGELARHWAWRSSFTSLSRLLGLPGWPTGCPALCFSRKGETRLAM